VRNPVAVAMAACSFVKTAVHAESPLFFPDEESKRTVREDVDVIDSSLAFVNDLLRNVSSFRLARRKRNRVSSLHVPSQPGSFRFFV